jgi:PqqD family protein of HPr-rel-A system
MQWRLAQDRALLSRSWDGQCVVYDSGAGDTHLLDGPAALLFEQLASGPQDLATLAACLLPANATGRGRRGQRVASAFLVELAKLGLVESAP